MWKFKLATKVGAGGASNALPAGEKFTRWARYIGLVAAAAYILLGILNTVLAGFIIGPITIILGLGFAVIEIPFRPLAKFLTILQNFWFRAIAYGVAAIPTFFSIVTFVAGLIGIACGICYLIAAFKGQSGKPTEKAADAEKAEGKGEGKEDKDKKDKKEKEKKDKKDKKSSLASQGADEPSV